MIREWLQKVTLAPIVAGVLVPSLLLYSIGVAVSWILGYSSPIFFDFSAYYQTGYKLLHGYPLYADPSAFPKPPTLPDRFHAGPYGRNLYPPVLAFFYLPFSLLPFRTAGWMWSAVSLVALLIAVVYLLRSFDVDLSKGSTLFLLWCVAGFYPVKQGVYMGQITLFLAASLTMFAASLYRPSASFGRVHTGAFAALAVFVKPYYAVTMTPLLRSWRTLLASGATLFGLSFASVLAFGSDTYRRYLQVVFTGTGRPEMRPPVEEWVGGPYRPLFLVQDHQVLVQLASLVSVAVFAFVVARRGSQRTHKYLFTLGISLLVIFPFAVKKYTLVALVPAILVALYEEHTRVDGVPVVPLFTALSVHLHVFGVKFLLAVAHAVDLPVLFDVIPLLQPALWGTVALFVFSIVRLTQEYDSVA